MCHHGTLPATWPAATKMKRTLESGSARGALQACAPVACNTRVCGLWHALLASLPRAMRQGELYSGALVP